MGGMAERKVRGLVSEAAVVAQAFHESYERLAPDHGYETREASAKPWAEVPKKNQRLMIAVVDDLIARGVIAVPYVNRPVP